MIRSIMQTFGATKRAKRRRHDDKNRYDCVQAGPVWASMWEDKHRNVLQFTVYRLVRIDAETGEPVLRTSIDAAMIPDLVEALRKLAGKYAEEDRLPESTREKLRAYCDVLKTVPTCVGQEIASAEVSAGNSVAS